LLENSGGKRLDFGPFSKGEKAKEDRQFESPLLQQRGTANRREALRTAVIAATAEISLIATVKPRMLQQVLRKPPTRQGA
jgi:hypothetical protein